MLGLIILEVYNPLFIITNENTKFEVSKPIEKRERRHFLKYLQYVDGNFRPEILQMN